MSNPSWNDMIWAEALLTPVEPSIFHGFPPQVGPRIDYFINNLMPNALNGPLPAFSQGCCTDKGWKRMDILKRNMHAADVWMLKGHFRATACELIVADLFVVARVLHATAADSISLDLLCWIQLLLLKLRQPSGRLHARWSRKVLTEPLASRWHLLILVMRKQLCNLHGCGKAGNAEHIWRASAPGQAVGAGWCNQTPRT